MYHPCTGVSCHVRELQALRGILHHFFRTVSALVQKAIIYGSGQCKLQSIVALLHKRHSGTRHCAALQPHDLQRCRTRGAMCTWDDFAKSLHVNGKTSAFTLVEWAAVHVQLHCELSDCDTCTVAAAWPTLMTAFCRSPSFLGTVPQTRTLRLWSTCTRAQHKSSGCSASATRPTCHNPQT